MKLTSIFFAAAMSLSTLASAAQPLVDSAAAPASKPDEKKLVAKVFADGTLFGFAQICKVPERDLKKLYDIKFASSREFGMAKVPQYTQQRFRTDFQNGIATAGSFSVKLAPTSEAHRENCAEVRNKVQAIIGKK